MTSEQRNLVLADEAEDAGLPWEEVAWMRACSRPPWFARSIETPDGYVTFFGCHPAGWQISLPGWDYWRKTGWTGADGKPAACPDWVRRAVEKAAEMTVAEVLGG